MRGARAALGYEAARATNTATAGPKRAQGSYPNMLPAQQPRMRYGAPVRRVRRSRSDAGCRVTVTAVISAPFIAILSNWGKPGHCRDLLCILTRYKA